MKAEQLKKFPKFLRLDHQYQIEYVWGIEEDLQRIIRQSLHDKKLTSEKALSVKEGTLELFQIPGSLKYLVILNKNFDQLFPLDNLTYAAAPQTVIDIIADWVKQSVQFERFDLVRINRPLRRFNFEYSMGMDIEGVIRSAYKDVADSALAWLLNNEKPYLVENFTRETCRFSEDPALYQTGFRSVLRVPIFSHHGLIGAILLAALDPESYQPEDAVLLQALAQSAASAFFLAGVQQEQEYHTLATSTLLQTIAGLGQLGENAEFLNYYCRILCELAKTDRVILFLINKQEDKYCCIAEAGKKLAHLGEWLPIGKLPFKEVIRTKTMLAFNLADPRYEPLMQLLGQGLTAVLYAPIIDAYGNIIACLGTATSDESAMSKGTAGLFKVASEHLGFIMRHSFPHISNIKISPAQPARKQAGVAKPPGFEEIIGSSKVVQDTIKKAAAAAQYEFPILLFGETGTGKELFAKAIHRASSVSKGPFIVVNSAAIPHNLLESELFGYKEGAFTGGVKGGKRGKILLAHGGTLFFDEIGELPLDLQAKLLRVIQEKEVEPLGAEKPVPIDVRIISATHRDLKEMVKNQQFREDLYYRLNSIEIKIPPLRDRGEDIIELAENILEELAKRSGKRAKRLSPETRQVLLKYNYPGNVRELQNIINWAFVFSDDEVIKIDDLSPAIQKYTQSNTEMSEREALAKLLIEFNGNKTALARHLGITRTGLWKKLKRLGLQ
jgi:transcriptional regulator with GAF, ATPase, and Fis domain